MLGFNNKRQNINTKPPYSATTPNPPSTDGMTGMGKAPAAQRPQMQQGMSVQGQPQQYSAETEEYINARIAEIDAQVRDFSRKNPDFDMRREMQNPAFCNYVWVNGLSVEDAYYLVHREDNSEPYKKPDTPIAAQRRIFENGTGRTAGSGMVKKNPKDLSDDEVDDIVKRVRNGEKISF